MVKKKDKDMFRHFSPSSRESYNDDQLFGQNDMDRPE